MEVYTKILGNSHSPEWAPRLKDAKIHTEIFGSDHCPVELILE